MEFKRSAGSVALVLVTIAVCLMTFRWGMMSLQASDDKEKRPQSKRSLFGIVKALKIYANDDDNDYVFVSLSNSTSQQNESSALSVVATNTIPAAALKNITTAASQDLFVSLVNDPPSVEMRKQHFSASTQKLDLELAKELCQNVLSRIYRRYELHENGAGYYFWRTASNIGTEIWDIMKYKIAKKALDGNQTFLMIFGGSSVTAGHDSFYNQSYPSIFESRMSALFSALGIQLVVHNIAQSANNCNPSDLCYESMGGRDPDWVGWEQSYNCGHDEAMFEITARWAGWSKNRGLAYFSASGAWAPGSCPLNNVSVTGSKVPFCDEQWKEEDAGLTKWMPTQADVAKEKELQNSFFKARSSVARFTGWADASYKGIGPHGFNVWEGNPNCQVERDGKIVKGCNAADAGGGCNLKFMTKEASWYGMGGGKAHHPTRAFHMLRGEAIAWLYAMIALDAAYMLEVDMLKSSKDALKDVYSGHLEKLQPPMPPPKKCQHLHCDAKPICFTNYMPHYPKYLTLSSIKVGQTNWSSPSIEENRNEYDDWTKRGGYKDAKVSWTANGPYAGEVHFDITIGEKDFLWVVGEYLGGNSLTQVVFFIDVNGTAAIRPNEFGNGTVYTPTPNRVQWTKLVRQSGEFVHLVDLPRGHHVLSLLHNYTEATKTINSGISHIVMWP